MVIKNTALSAEASTRTEVFYPETDGMPLADGDYQFEHFMEILFLLRSFFRDRPDVAVKGNTIIYYVEGNPHLWVSPDCYVAFGVDLALLLENNNYRVWEMGKVPDFVLEIGSPSTASNDTGDKRDLYARLGIGEYWRFDPSGGDHYGEPLAGETLVDGEYRLLDMREDADGGTWGYSPTLGLEFHWTERSLRLYDPVGRRWLQTSAELEAARVAAETRAESAETRMAELEAELRRVREMGK